MDERVFKITRQGEWRSEAETHAGSPDDARDGFIHLSTAAQVPGTLARHFRGEANLLLLEVDAAALGSALRWEPSRGGELFPHLYGPLPTRAVRAATAISSWSELAKALGP